MNEQHDGGHSQERHGRRRARTVPQKQSRHQLHGSHFARWFSHLRRRHHHLTYHQTDTRSEAVLHKKRSRQRGDGTQEKRSRSRSGRTNPQIHSLRRVAGNRTRFSPGKRYGAWGPVNRRTPARLDPSKQSTDFTPHGDLLRSEQGIAPFRRLFMGTHKSKIKAGNRGAAGGYQMGLYMTAVVSSGEGMIGVGRVGTLTDKGSVPPVSRPLLAWAPLDFHWSHE